MSQNLYLITYITMTYTEQRKEHMQVYGSYLCEKPLVKRVFVKAG